MKKAIVSVINDLVTDQRVHKVCTSLHEMGYEVHLVGRRQRASQPLAARAYATHRMFLLFEKGPLFYLMFQFRLFFFLLFRKADVLVANDLDTLLPNYWIARLKGAKVVYDAHEIFTEVPELTANPGKKKTWKRLERYLVPKMKYMFTVNDSISDWYYNEYGVRALVLRNIPLLKQQDKTGLTRNELDLPADKKIILLQGAGINIQRGAEEAVEAMAGVHNALLLIIGSGDVVPFLKQYVEEKKLGEKVRFLAKQPLEKLRAYTQLADLGLTLDKNTNINYRFSLPNKLFDYIHAGVPVLASDLVEVRNIVEKYKVGTIAVQHDPQYLANLFNSVLADEKTLAMWKENAKLASRELNWQNEEKVLKTLYANFLS